MSTEKRRRAAAALIRRGAVVIPVPIGEKNPGRPGWEAMRITEEEVSKYWTAGNPDKWPEPPEAVRKVAEAMDPQGALESIRGGASWDTIPYDAEALTTERVIRPRSLVAGQDVYDQEVEDLSE